MQRVERRLLIQAVAALSHEPFERLTLRVVRLARLKQRERQLQRRQLQLHHGGVIHPPAARALANCFCVAGFCHQRCAASLRWKSSTALTSIYARFSQRRDEGL